MVWTWGNCFACAFVLFLWWKWETFVGVSEVLDPFGYWETAGKSRSVCVWIEESLFPARDFGWNFQQLDKIFCFDVLKSGESLCMCVSFFVSQGWETLVGLSEVLGLLGCWENAGKIRRMKSFLSPEWQIAISSCCFWMEILTTQQNCFHLIYKKIQEKE